MMKPNVTILVPGYASTKSGGHSCSTITLVQFDGQNMIVDPGSVPSPQVIVKALKDHDLTLEDINIVFVTHAHPDHYRSVSLFPKARQLDWWGWWNGDLYEEFDGQLYADIKIINTPGHSYDSVTLLVKTEQGLIAICGDVFWKENFPKKDPFASDLDQLKKSRVKVLKIADYIIPGHGEIYQSP